MSDVRGTWIKIKKKLMQFHDDRAVHEAACFNENKIRRGKFHVHVFEASIFGERVRSISQEFARN